MTKIIVLTLVIFLAVKGFNNLDVWTKNVTSNQQEEVK